MGVRQVVLADADDLTGPRDGGLEGDFGRVRPCSGRRGRQRLLRQGQRCLAGFEEGQDVVRQAWLQAIQIVDSFVPVMSCQCAEAGLTLLNERYQFHTMCAPLQKMVGWELMIAVSLVARSGQRVDHPDRDPHGAARSYG